MHYTVKTSFRKATVPTSLAGMEYKGISMYEYFAKSESCCAASVDVCNDVQEASREVLY